MQKRFVSIWFRYLLTDWHKRRQPALAPVAFVLVAQVHGRPVIMALNNHAGKKGICLNMVLADAKALLPSLQYFDHEPERPGKLITALATWCLRYTPSVAVDLPQGLLLDVTGCAHLWGGEKNYLADIRKRLEDFGYHINIGMADTIGAAWAMARFGSVEIIESGQQHTAMLSLPAASLRLDDAITTRLEKLGLYHVQSFINMPHAALRRRFGPQLLQRLDEAIGNVEETMELVKPIAPYQERLPCLEPIVTATGIEIALERLIEALCKRLKEEEKGLRLAAFTGYRMDGKIVQLTIGTTRPSANCRHIFKLFEIRICEMEPATGIELFTLEALTVEDLTAVQEQLWQHTGTLQNSALAELLDRLGGKIGAHNIHRYVPAEHYWPERSFRQAATLEEPLQTNWNQAGRRPLHLLTSPELIEVTSPLPDYPPMLFRYKGKLHKIVKADGPERIEQEWWLQEGQHRDYYYVEDEEGRRYWLFRLGHYDVDRSYKWYMHGFFS